MADSVSQSRNGRENILIRGARANNLKNINIDIPRGKFVVITGLSGSGKSSLAFDTIYAEGNRRYMEGLSSYARNFLEVVSKPDVDSIDNLSPTISIDQKSIGRSSRSTVGTLTEIYDYLRVVFSKIGEPQCSECGTPMKRKSSREILDEILNLPHRSQLAILAPVVIPGKNLREILRQIEHWGYARVRFNGKISAVSEALSLADEQVAEAVDAVVDRLLLDTKNPDRERIMDSLETAFKLGNGSAVLVIDQSEERSYNQDFYCNVCKMKIKEITPRHFSFNNPEGACPNCSGLGVCHEIDSDLVVPNKNLSIIEGAIQPWSKAGGKTNGHNGYIAALGEMAKKYKFSLEVPIKSLSKEQLEKVLFGDGGAGIFEGVIPGLEKKYKETKSDYFRSEIERYMIARTCPDCSGKRLRREFLSVLVAGKSIDELANASVIELKNFLLSLSKWPLDKIKRKTMIPLVKEITERLVALEDVGLEYLSMARSSQTISGGEAQRIRLAIQIKSELMGIIYILDEPSIGLHRRDTEKLIHTLTALREAGNSLLVVEHDGDIIRSADWIIDMGPGAGEEGGEIIFEGDKMALRRVKTLTSQYLFGGKKVEIGGRKRALKNIHFLEIVGASEHNLKNIDVKIPLGKFVAISGVSGSGKSSLVSDILVKALSKHFYKSKEVPGKHKKIKGLEHVDKIISVNQDPIGRTPRSNAATYTGLFSHIRDLFASTEEAKSRGYTASQFSFNMRGGRCELCQGEGVSKIEMHLLPDMYVKCESCGGTRYNKKTLEIEYRGVNIANVLDMSVSYALRFFRNHPLIVEKLKTMEEVGLGYLKLGQSATNLSGGEAQRIKLATELARKSTGKTLYVLDEPTIGLHFEDINRLLKVLNALVEKGNTVLVVEHNLDVIRSADWVVELGPEGGEKGGQLLFEGAPEELKKCKESWTGKYL